MQNLLLDERQNVYIIDFPKPTSKHCLRLARLEPIFLSSNDKINTEQDLVDMLRFEQGLASVSTLSENRLYLSRLLTPRWRRPTTCWQVRQYAKTAVIFEKNSVLFSGMLEWTLTRSSSTARYHPMKKLAIYSAALIVQQILRLRP